MDDILKAIKEALDDTFGGEEKTKKVPVGKISPDLLRAVKEHDDREEDLKEYIQAKLRLLALEAKREFQPQTDAMIAEHREIWARIHDEVGLTEKEREDNYTLSMKTGEVYRKVAVEDEPPFKFQ